MTEKLSRRELIAGLAATGLVACTPNVAPASRTPQLRSLVTTYRGVPARDGAGVSLTRVIGQPRLDHLDPFLLLDQIHSDDPNAYIRGFPNHPHRGFETVTVMLDGRMRHGDSRGRSGLIQGGGAQWMTAGRGIVHSEIPEQDNGMLWGFQLWINLPAREKMRAPEYQDLQPGQLTELAFGRGANARLIAGHVEGARGPVRDRVTEPTLMTLRLGPNARAELPVSRDQTAFAFVFEGSATTAGNARLQENELGVFGNDGARIRLTGGERGAGILLAAAAPLHEPIARRGPFVMNTQEEIERAFYDYQNGTLAL